MNITKETKIAVLSGGISNEREISLRSGTNCSSALKRLGYKNTLFVDLKQLEDLIELKQKKIEIAFLTTHGRFGEDGALQGALEWLKIPYTGSSILASAISMDKWLTKQIAKALDISLPKAFLLTKSILKTSDLKKIWDELSKTNNAVFLKPRNDGSSVNTFKIKSLSELEEKVKSIDLNTSDYLIEEFIAGREITMSLIETNDDFKVLPALEIKPKNEFYDYEAKYTKGMTKFILPAKLESKCLDTLTTNSKKLFTEIGCSSFGRVDYMLDNNNTPHMLEINSLPGMTDTSDLPAQAANAGINYDELVEIILKTARLHN